MRKPEVAPIPPPESLQDVVLWTVVYSGIFEFPLRREEVFYFLIAPEQAFAASRADVEAAVDTLLATGVLESDGTFVYPAGRGDWVLVRWRRRHIAQRAWMHARAYGRLIWMLPYVRMVAVTGALAMDNVGEGDDIDFFVVVEPGRLWLTRGMILALVKLARVRGVTLCPNFILSTRVLRLDQRDLYTAHELAQMVPLHGASVVNRIFDENPWYRDYLPNAGERNGTAPDDSLPLILRGSKALSQAVLDLPLGTWIERWEQRRKIRKLLRAVPPQSHETRYTADMCKGHADGHGSRVMDRWRAEIAGPNNGVWR